MTEETEPSSSETWLPIDQIKTHPLNYNTHPEEEIVQLVESIREHGLYRRVVVARDGTLLAGHGVTQALLRLGRTTVPVVRYDLDPTDQRALKLLIADNEIGRLAERDDRKLTELLKDIKDQDGDLLGTGYDEMMLANLVFVSRSRNEIADQDEAAEWVGLPEYQESGERSCIKIHVQLPTKVDFEEFCRRLEVKPDAITQVGLKQVLWWPKRATNDLVNVKFTDAQPTLTILDEVAVPEPALD